MPTNPSGKERTVMKQYEILTAGNLEQLIKRKTPDDECCVDTVRLCFISRTYSNNNAILTYIIVACETLDKLCIWTNISVTLCGTSK